MTALVDAYVEAIEGLWREWWALQAQLDADRFDRSEEPEARFDANRDRAMDVQAQLKELGAWK